MFFLGGKHLTLASADPSFPPWDFLRSRKLVITAAQALHTHSPVGERSRVWFGGKTHPKHFPI